MIQRPKFGETEEDLLRQEEEFLKASGKEPPVKRKIEETQPKPLARNEVLIDIKERTFGTFKPSELKFQETKGFPKAFTIDSTLVQRKKAKKSLFAMQLEKNRNVTKNEMEVEETNVALDEGNHSDFSHLKEQKTIHEENLNKLAKMSEKDILEEQKKLLSTLDPKFVEFLKARGKEKDSTFTGKKVKIEDDCSIKPDENEIKKNVENYVDSKWVNMDFLEKDKLEWIGDIPDKKFLEPDQPYSARFDFKGELQPFSTEIDVRNSLYHHGDEPNRPGYTIQELYQLSRSQILQQRIIALTTLANIIRKTKLGYYDRCFDGQLLHKLVESDLFFLLRFSIDENSLIPSSMYCLHNLLCNESDEFCLDKLLGVTYIDEQPLLFNKIDASEDDEKELKDHVVIGCDMIKGVLRTDLLIRLAYVLSNFAPPRETVIRAINCLIRISRHSLEATTSVLRTPNLLKIVYSNIRTNTPVYECVKLLRVMASHSKTVALEICKNHDLRFLVSFVEDEENPNVSKKEFYLLKLETLYFWRSLLLHDIFVNEFLMWSPSLIRLLLFYNQKVDVSAENDFDFEMFSAMTSLIVTCNRKKIQTDSNTLPMMRVCLEKWLTQLIQRCQYNFSASKAVGSAFRYFTSYYKSFGVNSQDLEFIYKINALLVALFQSDTFRDMSHALRTQSYLLSPTKVTRDPDNLPSLQSVYDGGEEFLRIVQNSSALPFFISLVKYLKTVFHISHETKPNIHSFLNSENIQKYISKVSECSERVYNWFMKFETQFLVGCLQLLVLTNDENVLSLGFGLLPLLRVDDPKGKKVLSVLCDKNNWKITESFLDHLPSLYSELLLESREKSGVLNYKKNLVPEEWPYKIFSHLRGKEAVAAVTNALKLVSLVLTRNRGYIKKIPHTLRFYNLCYVFLTDSNVFDENIQDLLEVIFGDILANQEVVNLNMKIEKKKSFYDLYTELITQYAGVSYGLPIFGQVVLFPLQNRFNVSYRKLLWFEYMHVLRVVTLPYPSISFTALKGFVEPCETDESLLVAYINSVSNNVITKQRNPFVYNIAIGNVRNFLNSTNQDEKLVTFLQKKINDLKSEELKNDIINFSL